MSSVRKSFLKNLFMTKSNELRSDFFSGTFHVGSTVTASCSGNLEQLNNYIVQNTANATLSTFLPGVGHLRYK